jgi:hypothetical protein
LFFSFSPEGSESKALYIFGGLAPEQKPHDTERSRGNTIEAKKERQKPLLAESAPSNHNHMMNHPTDTKNWGDVDAGSPRGAGGGLRGE